MADETLICTTYVFFSKKLDEENLMFKTACFVILSEKGKSSQECKIVIFIIADLHQLFYLLTALFGPNVYVFLLTGFIEVARYQNLNHKSLLQAMRTLILTKGYSFNLNFSVFRKSLSFISILMI